MTPTNTDEIAEFQREFAALVKKYRPEVHVICGWHGKHKGYQICVGEKAAADFDAFGRWIIGDETIDIQAQ